MTGTRIVVFSTYSLGGHKLVVKSNSAAATQHAAQRLEKVIESHRSYFSEWRSSKFERLNDSSLEANETTVKVRGGKTKNK